MTYRGPGDVPRDPADVRLFSAPVHKTQGEPLSFEKNQKCKSVMMTAEFKSARFSNVPGIKKTEKLNVLWTFDFFEMFSVKHKGPWKGPPYVFTKKGAPFSAPPLVTLLM